MKPSTITACLSVFCLITPLLHAQPAPDVQQLQTQLQQMQQEFERVQQQHRQQIEQLQKQLDALQKQQSDPATEQNRLREMMSTPIDDVRPSTTEPERPWRPTDPIRIGSGSSFIDIGLIGTFAVGGSTADDVAGGTQLGGHDPNRSGFSVQSVELTLSGMVDPYFRANAHVLFGLEADGDGFVELEEVYAETLSLPANLQLRAGHYLTEFGRHNILHPHSWSFVDVPLVNARFLGPDGLRNPGARLSWLTPTPFYSELFLSIQESGGSTAHSFRSSGGHAHDGDEDELPFAFRHPDNDRGVHGLRDMLIAPRYAVSFDLAETQTILLGASAAFAPNASGDEDARRGNTQIYGADLTWKWRPVSHTGGFPFVAWQTEAMMRRYQAGSFDWDENGDGVLDADEIGDAATGLPAVFPRERLTDYGFYSQLLYGFRKNWVAGMRFDYVTRKRADYERMTLMLDGEPLTFDPSRAARWRLSPNLTWFPSEFSKLRLQYNYDDRKHIGADHSVWLQMEFLLGAHGAHKF